MIGLVTLAVGVRYEDAFSFCVTCTRVGILLIGSAGNKIVVHTKDVDGLDLYLDERLVDLSEPIAVDLDGSQHELAARPSLATLCETLAERGDPEHMFTVRLSLPVDTAQARAVLEE